MGLVTSYKSTRLPKYLQNMLAHRECLFHEARRSNDWSSYRAYTEKFSKCLKKYNAHLEKKVIESRNKQRFYKYLTSKIHCSDHVACLKQEGVIATTAQDKANMLANSFVRVFQKDDGKALPPFSPKIEAMVDFPWFEGKKLYDLLIRWPRSTSVTPDFVPLFFLQKIAYAICSPLHTFSISQ